MKRPVLTIGVASYGIQTWMLEQNISSLKEALRIIPEDKFEIIFMDDKDPNNSYKLAEKEFAGFNNVKVIRNEVNLKLSKGKTEMMKYTNGEYFQRVDADDWVNPTELADYIKYLETNEHDLIINGYVERGRRKRFNNEFKNPRGRSHLFTGNVTYRTELLKKVPEPKYITNMAEDVWMIINALLLSNSYEHTSFTWYQYRGKGTTGVLDFINNLEEFEATSKELCEVEFDSRIDGKDRAARLAEHTIMRILTGMVWFRAIKHGTRPNVEKRYVIDKFIKPNKNLYKNYKRDWYHNNLFKFTFAWFVRPFNSIIKYFIKKEAYQNEKVMNENK